MDQHTEQDVRDSVQDAREHVGNTTEAALLALDRAGVAVSWSDCARCGHPRDAHGLALICPRP